MDRTQKVWDPAVRLFHWSLVASFMIAWLTADTWDDVHEVAGYVAGGLIAFRLIWGLMGPRYARFRQFVRAPRTVFGYLMDIITGRERRYIGHNPAGGAMIIILLAGVAIISLTGWMYTTDAFWGSTWVEATHELVTNGVLLCIVLHLAGVVWASLRHRENLVRAMLSGHKRAAAGDDVA